MNIFVKYLAQARPAAGRAEETVALHEPACIKDLLKKVADTHGEPLRQILLTADGLPHPSLLLFMHNRQVHASATHGLRDTDEIVVLPPMAGG